MVIASSHVFVFSFWWKVPKGYIALEQIFVSARTMKKASSSGIQSLFNRNNLEIETDTIPKDELWELQKIEDEMTDDKLRMWMLLAFARPCGVEATSISRAVA